MRDIEPRKTPCYCMNFRRIANVLTKFYDNRLASADLTANQLSLLIDIQSIEPCNRSELARPDYRYPEPGASSQKRAD